MAIVLATTTVTLLSPGSADTDAEDWGGAPDPETGFDPVATGIRAHLSAPSGSSFVAPEGSTVETVFRLIADPCVIEPNMQVRDDSTGETYSVAWSLSRGFPIPHVVAGLTHATKSA